MKSFVAALIVVFGCALTTASDDFDCSFQYPGDGGVFDYTIPDEPVYKDGKNSFILVIAKSKPYVGRRNNTAQNSFGRICSRLC